VVIYWPISVYQEYAGVGFFVVWRLWGIVFLVCENGFDMRKKWELLKVAIL